MMARDMAATRSGVLTGVERLLVHNRLRATVGLNCELPYLLRGVQVAPGARCLEVGSGLGWGSLGLARRFDTSRVTAIDYDATVLPRARALHERHGIGARVECCQADVTSLPFPDETFDLVLGLYVLHHFGGYRAPLREIGRVMKPGALFLFADPVHIRFMPRLRGIVPPDGLPDWADLRSWAAEAGLRVERRRGLPFLVFGRMRKVAAASDAPDSPGIEGEGHA